jgi:hypothetical protein
VVKQRKYSSDFSDFDRSLVSIGKLRGFTFPLAFLPNVSINAGIRYLVKFFRLLNDGGGGIRIIVYSIVSIEFFNAIF